MRRSAVNVAPNKMSELHVYSTSLVAHHLSQLEKKGRLIRDPENPRNYVVFEAGEKKVVYLGLDGLAQCGPKGSFLDDKPIEDSRSNPLVAISSI